MRRDPTTNSAEHAADPIGVLADGVDHETDDRGRPARGVTPRHTMVPMFSAE
jgi:hypothetical protein